MIEIVSLDRHQIMTQMCRMRNQENRLNVLCFESHLTCAFRVLSVTVYDAC